MAVMVGKDDELLFLFEELAIGELNSYNQFQEPLEYTFLYIICMAAACMNLFSIPSV